MSPGNILPLASFARMWKIKRCKAFFIPISTVTNQLEPRTLPKQKRNKIMRALGGPPESGECSGGNGHNSESGWCWHEFRSSKSPCAIFVVQLLNPAGNFRWQSVVSGKKRALVCMLGQSFTNLVVSGTSGKLRVKGK